MCCISDIEYIKYGTLTEFTGRSTQGRFKCEWQMDMGLSPELIPPGQPSAVTKSLKCFAVENKPREGREARTGWPRPGRTRAPPPQRSPSPRTPPAPRPPAPPPPPPRRPRPGRPGPQPSPPPFPRPSLTPQSSLGKKTSVDATPPCPPQEGDSVCQWQITKDLQHGCFGAVIMLKHVKTHASSPSDPCSGVGVPRKIWPEPSCDF